MLAIIKQENEEQYVSPVFGVLEKGHSFDWKLIVLDPTYSYIKKIEYYRKERIEGSATGKRVYCQVWIIDNEQFSFMHKAWKGLKCVVANGPLMHKLKKSIPVSVEEVPELEGYTKKIELPEWFEVKTEKDINSLMNVSCVFHDGTIEEYIQEGNDCIIKIDGTLAHGLFTLRFVDIIESDIMDKVGMILDSNITKTADGFCWEITDGFAGWTDGIDFDAPFDKTHIKCKKIFWQIEID